MSNGEDPFSGLWRMSPQKSNFDPNHRPSEGTMRFEREHEGYVMRAEGISDGKHVEEQPHRFIFDGKEHPVPGAPDTVAMSTRADPNTIHVTARKGNQIIGEGTYVVSADGSTLITTVKGIDAQQRSFQSTVVWDRQ